MDPRIRVMNVGKPEDFDQNRSLLVQQQGGGKAPHLQFSALQGAMGVRLCVSVGMSLPGAQHRVRCTLPGLIRSRRLARALACVNGRVATQQSVGLHPVRH